jgi:xylan 1,4-beta-xylosidase
MIGTPKRSERQSPQQGAAQRTTPVQRSMICNPVLRGFHPDPSLIRVGQDYYLATSTFEWFPGVPLFHSRDLVHWRPIGHAITRLSQVDMRGVPDSGGVWAPSLSHHAGRFYLAYSNVRTKQGPFKDVHNYLITAPDILGPWSDPIYLNSSGFDPSLFHDSDGRQWVLNVQWDHRQDHFRFGGIVLQEYSASQQRLVGPIRKLLESDEVIEGPNLYKVNGRYYLIVAEGGTGYGHGVLVAQSDRIEGPYEVDPAGAMLTSRHAPGNPLQKAGHAEIVQTPLGEWYMAHLCARPLYPSRRCPLGRETALQRIEFAEDGRLRLAHGSPEPQLHVAPPVDAEQHSWPIPNDRDDFDLPTLDLEWSTLRTPVDERRFSLSARPGWLRIYGRESLSSLFEQSLLARRQTSFACQAQTRVEFHPTHFSQAAGLICWYDTETYYYLQLTHDDRQGVVLQIVLSDKGRYDELLDARLCVQAWPGVHLRAQIDHARLQFFASPDERQWQPVGPVLDASRIADDYAPGLKFTGSFIGICAQDLGGTALSADFDYFELSDRTA